MKFLIPTAKELAPLSNSSQKSHSLSQKSQAIIHELAKLDDDQLEKLYKIKPQAVAVEKRRIQALSDNNAPEAPALNLFNGLMYRNIDRDLTEDDKAFTSEHVFITSALYGIINALEPISEHRLDFNCQLKIDNQSLKVYWHSNYDSFLQESDEPIISLLSSEFESVFSPAYAKSLIKVSFHEDRDGVLKTHSTISKKGRGKFLTQIIQQKPQNLESLKELSFDDFYYQSNLSTDKHLVFVKTVTP